MEVIGVAFPVVFFVSFFITIVAYNLARLTMLAGADPEFQVRGAAHLKKLRRAEGGAKIFGVLRVKNHDFTPKIIFFPIAEGSANILGYFV